MKNTIKETSENKFFLVKMNEDQVRTLALFFCQLLFKFASYTPAPHIHYHLHNTAKNSVLNFEER